MNDENGATEGTRTPDRLITNQLLYQLSYGGRILYAPRTCPLKEISYLTER